MMNEGKQLSRLQRVKKNRSVKYVDKPIRKNEWEAFIIEHK